MQGPGPVRASRRPERGPRTWTVVAAAALTVVVTVVADAVAGNHLGHVAALGALAVILGVARVRSSPRHRARFSALSALIAVQPSLGAVCTAGVSPGGWHTVDVDDLTSSVQVVLVILIAAAIGSAQIVLEAVADGLENGLVVLTTLARALVGDQMVSSGDEAEAAVRRAEDRAPRPGRLARRHDARRRGPPVLRVA